VNTGHNSVQNSLLFSLLSTR